jgi:hypothetical protein
MGGINLGKFFDRITTVSMNASPTERAIIGVIPGVIGAVTNIAAPGAGAITGGLAKGLIHESSGSLTQQYNMTGVVEEPAVPMPAWLMPTLIGASVLVLGGFVWAVMGPTPEER